MSDLLTNVISVQNSSYHMLKEKLVNHAS